MLIHVGATPTIIVVSDCDTPIKKTARSGTYEKKSPSDFKTTTMTDFRNITGESETPLKASKSKISVLKQSRLEAFCHQDPGIEVMWSNLFEYHTANFS